MCHQRRTSLQVSTAMQHLAKIWSSDSKSSSHTGQRTVSRSMPRLSRFILVGILLFITLQRRMFTLEGSILFQCVGWEGRKDVKRAMWLRMAFTENFLDGSMINSHESCSSDRLSCDRRLVNSASSHDSWLERIGLDHDLFIISLISLDRLSKEGP